MTSHESLGANKIKRERALLMSWPLTRIDPAGQTPSEVPGTKCAAVPRVVLHGWREDIGCASTANCDVSYGDRFYPICKMHRDSWATAFTRGLHHELATVWGWPRA